MPSREQFSRGARIALLAALCFLAAAAPAHAQGTGGPPGIDHYKVYAVLPPPLHQVPVVLRDQFGIATHLVREFPYFATPVSKDGVAMFDPVLHYDWWRIDPQPHAALVFATNQFGPEQQLRVGPGRFLLAPSLKFPVPGQVIPHRNHYKCYEAIAPGPGRIVTLEDQFGFNQAFVDSARWFCNPVEKQDPTGQYPIEDPEAHLVCYDITKTPPSQPRQVVTQDQFGFWSIQLVEDKWLCVPSFKTGVVAALPKSWGGVKAHYR